MPEFESKLKELWQKRTYLMQKKKKKKKKSKKNSAMKKKAQAAGSACGDTETNIDDDKTSFMTMTVADMKENEDFILSLIDDVKLV